MTKFQISRLVAVFFSISVILSTSSGALVHNVVDFGAKGGGGGGGSVDSTDAFLQAWNATCVSEELASVLVPEGEFLIGETLFSGPCRNEHIQFQIHGSIVAPTDDDKFLNAKTWITFESIDGLDLSGGTINARANSIWTCKNAVDNSAAKCQQGARSLGVKKGNNINIRGLTSMNSNQFHIVIESCDTVKVVGVNIVAPKSSPNTDGIHISRSTNVNITDSNIKTGDDCISIGPGTTGLYVNNCNCGPGHGISIGSLGDDEKESDVVENIRVEGVVFKGTQNGVRIKTWGKPTGGVVNAVTFHNITMDDVENPIIINQEYCPDGNCMTPVPSDIKIKNITYSDIRGTSSSEIAINFDCSDTTPCQDVKLVDVTLTPGKGAEGKTLQSSCKNVDGSTSGDVVPPACF